MTAPAPPPLSVSARWAWLPLPGLAAVLAVLTVADFRGVYELPAILQWTMPTFSTGVALVAAYVCARAYRVTGYGGVLALGCGVLAWGAGTGAASCFGGGNLTLTVHHAAAWLAALLHLAGVLTVRRQVQVRGRPELVLALGYGAVLAAVAAAVALTAAGKMPVFFVQESGGTPVRPAVPGSAIAMLAVATALLGLEWRRSRDGFMYRYALGLGLMTLGLLGVSTRNGVDGVEGWVGRGTQFVGGLYLLAAAAAWRRRTSVAMSLTDQLRQTEDRLTTFANATFEGVVETERGTVVDCNEQFARLAGRSVSQLRGTALAELLPPVQRARVRALLESGDEKRAEFELEREDGTVLWIEARGRPIAPGSARRLSVVRDVTEYRRALRDVQRAEEDARRLVATRTGELRKAEERYRAVVRNAAVGMALVGLDGRWLEANPAFERVLERSCDDLVGRPWQAALHPDEREVAGEGGPEIEALGPGREMRFLTPSGRTVWLEAHVSALRGSDGQVECYVTQWPDITARKEAERGREQLAQAVDALFVGAFWLDTSNRIVYVNQEACRSVGYTREELLGAPIALVAPPATPERMQHIWRELRHRGRFQGVGVHRRRDGTTFPIELVAAHVRVGGQEYNCGFVYDVSEREAAQEAQRRQLEELQRWQRVTIDRETRVLELKAEVNALRARLGEAPQYGAVGTAVPGGTAGGKEAA